MSKRTVIAFHHEKLGSYTVATGLGHGRAASGIAATGMAASGMSATGGARGRNNKHQELNFFCFCVVLFCVWSIKIRLIILITCGEYANWVANMISSLSSDVISIIFNTRTTTHRHSGI